MSTKVINGMTQAQFAAARPIEGSISHGTLRDADLLTAFAAEYERLVPFNSAATVAHARKLARVVDRTSRFGVGEAASDMTHQLFDELDRIGAVFGFYFGATEGDASDFGFWQIEALDDDEQSDHFAWLNQA